MDIFSCAVIFFRIAAIITVSGGIIAHYSGATRATSLYAMRRNLIRDSASMIVVSRVATGDG